MEYTKMEKTDFQSLQRTPLKGIDGILYLSSDKKRIFKLLYNFSLYQGIGDKKVLLEYLIKYSELKAYAAIPEELVHVPHKNKFGFWMTYFPSSIRLDEWCKGKDYETILKMFQKISVILKIFHEKYGIVVSDCYYTNILIVDDEFPIFVDVDSFSIEGIQSYTISNILYQYSKKQYWNQHQQNTYLNESKDSDNAALWLMFLETALNLPVRKHFLQRFSTYLKNRQDIEPIIKEIVKIISEPQLTEVPYLHEVSKQYQLYV